MNKDMQNYLHDYYTHIFPNKSGMQVSNLTSISVGWESDIYSFDLEYGPTGERQRKALILRIYPGDDAHEKSAREFHGMSQLYDASYPVPQVLILERENSPFDKPFVIMERIKGQMLWPLLFGSPGEKQQKLLTQFCDLLVQLHALEWRPFVDDVSKYDTRDPYILVDRGLTQFRHFLSGFPQSGFLPVLEWLEVRRDQVPCLRPSPIHWDFHPGNVLLRDDGSMIVVDWTAFDISDSRFDLAWTLLLISTHKDAKWRDIILHEYERLTETPVEQIEYFDVAACTRRLFSVVTSLSEGPEKLGMRPEAVAMMKQQMGAIERVYDLLLERTGIRVTQVEELFASLSQKEDMK
ncbi:MAG: phosphotransferase [Chloroflexi bacterium]|nr:phosphotransferase [Chloroflexota bacterium]